MNKYLSLWLVSSEIFIFNVGSSHKMQINKFIIKIYHKTSLSIFVIYNQFFRLKSLFFHVT